MKISHNLETGLCVKFTYVYYNNISEQIGNAVIMFRHDVRNMKQAFFLRKPLKRRVKNIVQSTTYIPVPYRILGNDHDFIRSAA